MSGLEGRDWSMEEAAKESLHEHQALLKGLRDRLFKLTKEWEVRASVTAQYGLVSSGAINQCREELERVLSETLSANK